MASRPGDIDLEKVDDTEFTEEDDANLVNDALSSFKAKYQKIAIEFGLPPDLVAEIKENNPRNAGNALNDVIVAWVKQEHNVGKFGHPCWRKVVKAALGAGNKLQAKKIAAAHPATPGVSPVMKLKPADSAPPPAPIPPEKIIEYNALDRRSVAIDGPGGEKIKVEYFDPFNIDRKKLQQIRFSFGVVKPKQGTKSSAVDEYSMNASPHGTALIINNEKFKEKSDRHGTAIDERNLTHIFRFLGYKVEVHRNLHGNEMLAIMDEMGRRSHTGADSFVCCILSHGQEGHIFGTDEVMVSLDDISKKVDASHCPSLAGKPKLFFLQACRGKMKEQSVRVGTDAGDEPSKEPPRVATDAGTRVATDSDTQIPHTDDFFFGYATPLGFVAWRDFDNGSWYISELCRALAELSTHVSLVEIMLKVNGKVGEYEHLGNRVSAEYTARMPKNVFF